MNETTKKKVYIADLKSKEKHKKILFFCKKRRKLAEIAAKFDVSYSNTSQTIQVLIAKGWVKKLKGLSNKVFYQTSDHITFYEEVKNVSQNPVESEIKQKNL